MLLLLLLVLSFYDVPVLNVADVCMELNLFCVEFCAKVSCQVLEF